MRIGYMRVSTVGQCLALQHDALTAAGCQHIYEDRLSGTARRRPGLDQALAHLKDGDTLVVYRLDRLGRSLRDLIELVSRLREMGCEFHSLSEAIDTATPGGKFMFHILAALAEFERLLIVERTLAGLQAARSRGKALGRPPVMTPKDVEAARALVAAGEVAEKVAARYGVGRSTLYRQLKRIRDGLR